MSAATAPDRSDVGGVIVTFFPDSDFARRLAIIAGAIGPLIVSDNSGPGAAQDRVRALSTGLGCEFLPHSENLGLATALNAGFRLHAAHGVRWVIAFDQDSTPEPGFVPALIATAQRDQSTHPAAIVGANWQDDARPGFASRHLRRHPYLPFCYTRKPADRDLDAVTCVIASGTLFYLPAWHTLGGFDEALFLDLVDADYCLRAAHAGHAVRVAAGARLRHRRGAKQPARRLGRTYWPAFMPPLRLRYLFRNRLRLMRRHLLHAPHWVAFELVYAAKLFVEILFLERRKLRKFVACLRGTYDGLLGRTGRIG